MKICKKYEKHRFQPAFGVRSTQGPIKIFKHTVMAIITDKNAEMPRSHGLIMSKNLSTITKELIE